jgi:hypothetical protein
MEEVTGSILVSPTSTKRASEQRKRDSEALCISHCSDLVLAECCTCLTDCVTMGDRFGGGRGLFASVFLRPWGSVTVHRRLVLPPGRESPRSGFGITGGPQPRAAHCLAKFEACKRVRTPSSDTGSRVGCARAREVSPASVGARDHEPDGSDPYFSSVAQTKRKSTGKGAQRWARRIDSGVG